MGQRVKDPASHGRGFHESPLGTLQSKLCSHSGGLLGSAPSLFWSFFWSSTAESDGEAGKARVCVLELSYQNERSWRKANTVEAQAKMEKTVPFMAEAIKSLLRNTMAGRGLPSCQDSSRPSLGSWPFLTSPRRL